MSITRKSKVKRTDESITSMEKVVGYYFYDWGRVIVEDFFTQFSKETPFAGEAPARYRRAVLEPGSTMSANDLVRNFLGRAQNMTAFQAWLQEEFRDSQPTSSIR